MATYRLPQGGRVQTSATNAGTEFVTRNTDGDVIASVTLPFIEAKPVVDTLRGLDTLAGCLNLGANVKAVIAPW
ncbi:hypothetical protein AB0N93_21040 [Streptomyces sp. NPDC091267]|uniref:hypothetical protein n=1 Tax=Streptomyces sp. NPDC091267 TaxID=3155195 RepID=UPI0034136CBE